MDPLLCAPAIGMVIQALGDNLHGSLLPSICAMRRTRDPGEANWQIATDGHLGGRRRHGDAPAGY